MARESSIVTADTLSGVSSQYFTEDVRGIEKEIGLLMKASNDMSYTNFQNFRNRQRTDIVDFGSTASTASTKSELEELVKSKKQSLVKTDSRNSKIILTPLNSSSSSSIPLSSPSTSSSIPLSSPSTSSSISSTSSTPNSILSSYSSLSVTSSDSEDLFMRRELARLHFENLKSPDGVNEQNSGEIDNLKSPDRVDKSNNEFKEVVPSPIYDEENHKMYKTTDEVQQTKNAIVQPVRVIATRNPLAEVKSNSSNDITESKSASGGSSEALENKKDVTNDREIKNDVEQMTEEYCNYNEDGSILTEYSLGDFISSSAEFYEFCNIGDYPDAYDSKKQMRKKNKTRRCILL